MKKLLSLVLALMMLMTSVVAYAESDGDSAADSATDAATTETAPVEVVEDLSWMENVIEPNKVVVEATETQVALEAWNKAIIEVDGLKFKDLNGNGTLDVYEDWRLDSETRAYDLLSQMTLKEKVGHLFHASTGGTFTAPYPYTEEWLWSNANIVTIDGATYIPMYHSILTDGVTTYLHNTNGTPETLLYENNTMQLIAESGRLGIPVVLSCDRSYNTFAGMVNLANYALGITHDEELVYNIVAQYAKEERALGFHVPFHSYGVEIGSWYGDEVNYIAKMITVETKAYEENGVNACTKHFVARGGRSGYFSAISPANLVDSWMVGWDAAVNEGGTSWIMLNNGKFLNNCNVCYDVESMNVLREQIGYDGCVVTDWPMWISAPSASGTTPDGRDLSQMTVGELYTVILEAGVDQVGTFFMVDGTDQSAEFLNANYPGQQQPSYPDAIIEQVETGKLAIEVVDEHVFRVLRNKFDLGLFEDPYGDLNEALELLASDEYKAEQFELTTIDDIYAARKDETNEMEIELQVKSSVLLKNDGVLPLQAGVKAYVTGNSDKTAALDVEAMKAYATVVENIEDADVIIARVTAMDDATEYIIEDAEYYNKPLVLVYDAVGSVSSEPNAAAVAGADAILFLTYSAKSDHGSPLGDFFTQTLPSVLADMLFGVKQPAGSLVFEIARTTEDATVDWLELALDTGVDTKTRLYMAATVRNNPTAQLPNNLGDVLWTTEFGMSYDQPADFEFLALTFPQVVGVVEEETSSGVSTKTSVVDHVVAGEPFTVYFIAQNNGGDGHFNADVYDNGNLIASKFFSVNGGDFIIAEIELTLEAGEHHITVLGMEKTLTIGE
ncbi:MAG: glycoside hydrolase family 3 protein [Clostridia bacterium]|nr:glycoside hydrolase family 3 protein [Clostridia bacterium]